MTDQHNKARRQLASCLKAIDDEYIDILAPLIVRMIVVVQRFFAAASHAAVDISVRNQLGEIALGIRTNHRTADLQSAGTGRPPADAMPDSYRSERLSA